VEATALASPLHSGFVDKGAYVFITGRRQNEVDPAVKQIGKNNNNVTGVQGDVSNLADLDRGRP
jgi:NADP-dependent 3-hydroxy acid dehydrogenase YdfG